jgi:hypothetical protein
MLGRHRRWQGRQPVERETTMGTKDKGGSKSSKKPPQKDIKEKRESKKAKRAASAK